MSDDNSLILLIGLIVFVGLIVAAEVGIDPSNWPNPYLPEEGVGRILIIEGGLS